MTRGFHKIWCDECGVEIIWIPVIIDNRTYCCQDCAIGLECSCGRFSPSYEEGAEFLQIEDTVTNPELTTGIDYIAE